MDRDFPRPYLSLDLYTHTELCERSRQELFNKFNLSVTMKSKGQRFLKK
ncbi:hypothetical protein HMPREF0105_0347 [Bacteroides sp. 3_1_33FAA]|uniref:Uncharacterized protein n=1 Tax=Phocaeicola dorei DSM 17855 TaxID=483217 RepID=B6W3T6_9BACT|nr:hypothetical protein BACDOR_04231 [Phocaeicola dorei DSM 17855]EEZ22964.1 hypothetical protein HMPREF0105_0347 [Bacteroides sp. 3_1_33FAA]